MNYILTEQHGKKIAVILNGTKTVNSARLDTGSRIY